MTNEKLDEILKQSLFPEIEDSEIQIRRKGRNNKTMISIKKIITCGLVACAALALVVTGGFFGALPGINGDGNADTNRGQNITNGNLFAITAYAAELPEGVTSGEVLTLSTTTGGYGSSEYLDNRFAISGHNIEKVKISTDKCNLYSVTSLYKSDPDCEKDQNVTPTPYPYEHLVIEGNAYEGAYNDNILFGMSVPKELRSNNDNIQAALHEDIDQVDGAILTIEVTFTDGNTEVHHYRLNTVKIYIPADENGYLQWDNLTRFLTADEYETPYTYGYLIEKID